MTVATLRQRKVADPDVPGALYFIQARVLRLIKVGFTSRTVRSRLQALQTGSPDELVLLGAMPGTIADEAALHHRFRRSRHHGEWFLPTPALLALANKHRGYCDPVIRLRVFDGRLVDALDEYARRQTRSRNNALNHILEQALRKAKLWPPHTPGEDE